jgi:hypothetical protein
MGDMSPRRAQRGRAATKETGNFHHEAHEGHEGKEIRRNFVPNFVLFVSFVVRKSVIEKKPTNRRR